MSPEKSGGRSIEDLSFNDLFSYYQKRYTDRVVNQEKEVERLKDLIVNDNESPEGKRARRIIKLADLQKAMRRDAVNTISSRAYEAARLTEIINWRKKHK